MLVVHDQEHGLVPVRGISECFVNQLQNTLSAPDILSGVLCVGLSVHGVVHVDTGDEVGVGGQCSTLQSLLEFEKILVMNESVSIQINGLDSHHLAPVHIMNGVVISVSSERVEDGIHM